MIFDYLSSRYDGGYRNSGYSRSNPNIAKVIPNTEFFLLKCMPLPL